MGFLVVISLPAVIAVAVLAALCYLLGRAREKRAAQMYGPPAPPPAVAQAQFQAQEKV